jgi:uncharacterized lipoprotein YddW (UPF0748 family)
MIRSYARAGINMVHPEIVYNGYSAYPSSYLTQDSAWGGLDVLAIIIDEAHKQGIEVHPWVWVFRVGNAEDHGGILKAHPDWAAVNKDGKTLSDRNGYWLCPSLPAVRRLLLRVMTEIVQKYPVDGIQLDFIRFDNLASVPYCYNESCREKFKAEYGIDPMDIEPFTEPVVQWHMWREEQVNSFVAEVSSEVKKIRPEVMVSAAVGSRPDDARLNLLQDWRHWVVNGWVDFVAPMSYTGDALNFLSTVCTASESVGAFGLLAPGIGLHRIDKGSEGMLEQVQVARTIPVPGVTLFASSYLDAERLKALAEGPFKKPARLPFRLPVEAAKDLAAAARDNMNDPNSVAGIAEATSQLALAKQILEHVLLQGDSMSYSPPSRPPIFIPDVVQPLPTIDVPVVKSPPVIDGKLDDAAWQSAGKAQLDFTQLGGEVTQHTDMLLAYDAENLYIAFRCAEPKLDMLRALAQERDGPLFADDSVEMFFVFEGEEDYLHFAVNAVGTRYDAKGYTSSWDPDWKAASGREVNAWTVEVAIPFASLGLSPKAGESWCANFCRNRMGPVGSSETQNMCWSPTYSSFHTPSRFGKLVFGAHGN